MADQLPPLNRCKERLSVLYIERGQLDVRDGAFVVVDVTGARTRIPVGGVACLMLEPGAVSAPPRPTKLVGGGVSLLKSKDYQ